MAKHKNKFSTRKHSVGGVISSLMAAGSIFLFVRAIVISYKAQGEGGVVVGALSLCALGVAIFGLLAGLLSYRESDRYYTFSFIGSLLNGIMTIIMVCMLLVGI